MLVQQVQRVPYQLGIHRRVQFLREARRELRYRRLAVAMLPHQPGGSIQAAGLLPIGVVNQQLGAIALISLVEYRNKKPFQIRFSGFVGISTTRTVSTSGEMVPSPMSPWQTSDFLCDSPILSG